MLLAGAALAGCASPADVIKAAAKDPAAACIVVSTPYGGLLTGRAMPGARVTIAGGACTIDLPTTP
jgi:hypothetical protein